MALGGNDGDQAEIRFLTLTEIIVLVQAIANAVLVFWVFKEYLNNQYLQAYVGGFVQANMVALDLAAIGVGLVSVLFLARFKNILFRRTQALSSETLVPDSGPLRARAEIRAKRTFDAASRGSVASDALASAAARVFRQMEQGQVSVANTAPPVSPVREGADSRLGSEQKLATGAHAPIPRLVEPGLSSQAKSMPDSRANVSARGEQRRDQVNWPIVQRPSTVVARPGLGQSVGERNLAQQHPPGLKPLEFGRAADRFSPRPPSSLKQAEAGAGAGAKPSIQLPPHTRHADSGLGPLDNPLPSNPLLPLLRQPEPADGRDSDSFLNPRELVTGKEVTGHSPKVNLTPQSGQSSPNSGNQLEGGEKALVERGPDPPRQFGTEQPRLDGSRVENRVPGAKRAESVRDAEDKESD